MPEGFREASGGQPADQCQLADNRNAQERSHGSEAGRLCESRYGAEEDEKLAYESIQGRES